MMLVAPRSFRLIDDFSLLGKDLVDEDKSIGQVHHVNLDDCESFIEQYHRCWLCPFYDAVLPADGNGRVAFVAYWIEPDGKEYGRFVSVTAGLAFDKMREFRQDPTFDLLNIHQVVRGKDYWPLS